MLFVCIPCLLWCPDTICLKITHPASVTLDKVSKFDGNTTNVMQFEAGVWFDKDIVQYDLSYLNCMVPGTTDLSACAGWEGGHQVVAGKKCQVFDCNPGEYCDGMSYTVGEYGYQSGGVTHPNAGCDSNQGIAFELCACSKR